MAVLPRRFSIPLPHLVVCAVLLGLLPRARALANETPDFERTIRPILSGKCFACHGPDEDAREADLRLDIRESAVADLGDYRAITPGKPDKSELIRRIESTDPDLRMPPPDSKLTLTKAEKLALRDWIAAGAPYTAHWAFIPPTRPALPNVSQADWVKNPIDRFVLARIEQAGLDPSPPADKSTLIRRVYLDLIGLPPTADEVRSFLSDQRPDAYERMVDRLLASPHYGERWARPWLDLARYADTNGYEKDLPRSIWPYRDWVIQAFNDDMPFDQFTIEQLAGDLLPNATIAQRIATGFHRNTMLNEEGGVDVEQFRFESLIDRVNTTGTVWLGLTIGCAQCHTHKYDPIQQKEYYEFLAFFNSCDEPELAIPDPEIKRQRARHETALRKKLEQLASHWPGDDEAQRQKAMESRFQQWLAEKEALAHDWQVLEPQLARALNGSTFRELEDHSLLVGGDHPNQDTYHVSFRPPLTQITGIRVEALPHPSLPDEGPGQAPLSVGKIITKGDFLLSEFEVFRVPADRMSAGIENYSGTPAGWEKLPVAQATATFSESQSRAELTLDGNLDTGWRIGDHTGEPQHIVFSLAEPVAWSPGDQLVVRLNQSYIHNMILGRFRVSATASDLPVLTSGLPADAEAALRIPADKRSSETNQLLRAAFLWTAPELKEAQDEIRTFRKTKPQYVKTLVMAERPLEYARTTHRHHRGEYLQPREVVKPDVPRFLHAFGDAYPRNRLGLAQWLVSRDNPLVARVTMNRQWQELFGRGIVRTSEDFGTQSSPPTHPQLLDYLAVEFMDGGWSLKRMHRLIVTSATYRQSSRATPELLEHDPDNVLLARAPRVRLDAETIRDTILKSAGLLTERVGGPSVFPPQPAGITALSYGALKWETAEGEDRYRRGLYTFAKRTAPYAMFTTFDGPTRETCVVRRSRSNTPLQALTLLNDVVFTEAAQAVGRHVAILSEPPAEVIDRMYWSFLARPADAQEQRTLQAFFTTQLDRFRAAPEQARRLCGVAPDSAIAPEQIAKQAAWTAVARIVINLDETITRN